MMPWSQNRIVRAVAEGAAKRLCRRAVARLQKMHHTLSGDDSELKTTWDEICIQVQGDQSLFWDAYEQAMRDALAWDVSRLPVHEQHALWLQTQEGEDWEFKDDEAERNEPPVLEDDIVEYVIRDYVLAEAGRWSNSRIRAFLDRANRWD